MQIILMEKVINVGQLGDVVKVKNGYARNFLIPQGKAKRATAANMAEFEARRADIEAADKAKLADAQARGEKLAGLTVQIVQKAGVDGKLFGSVTNADIATALAAQGFTVEKSQVRMAEGHLKQIGDHPVSIALHTDVAVGITVSVLGEH
ncbi:MAG: 50S ribosomal protein L9 [Gallionella sp.]|nr:50S ribosomal protein L9 [Gallionella sp.]